MNQWAVGCLSSVEMHPAPPDCVSVVHMVHGRTLHGDHMALSWLHAYQKMEIGNLLCKSSIFFLNL